MRASPVRYGSDIAAAVVVAIVGFALTILMVLQQRNTDYNKEAQRFAEEVRISTDAIAKRINLYTEIVAGLRDLFMANPALTRAEFERIATVHNVIKHYPEIINVRFVRWHPGGAGEPDRHIIEYLWPDKGNEGVRGMDISGQEANMASLLTARDTGLPAITAPFELRQRRSGSAIVLRMPVYRWAADTRLAGDTLASFEGTVGAVIDVSVMLLALHEAGAVQDLAVRMMDTGLTLAPENTVETSALLLAEHASDHFRPSEGRLAPQVRTIDVLGRRWELQFRPALSLFPDSSDRVSWWVGSAGVTLTIALVLLTVLLMRRRAQMLGQAQAQINWLTYHDALTQLPNRHLLRIHVQRALYKQNHDGQWGALMLLDMDHFKNLNEIRGHESGDQLLVQVAQRLRSHMPPGGFVARQGDDEFVILVPAVGTTHEAANETATAMAHDFLEQLKTPFLVANRPYRTTASLGITLFHGSLDTVDELLKRADLAMHQAKIEGRNTNRLYDSSMDAEMTTRATLEHDMRHGLEHGQFEAYYQPQVENDRVVGAELLLRWNHPERGMVSPALFIPLAERTGLIVALGEWVLKTACRQLAKWAQQPRYAGLHLSVNISPLEFHQERFVDMVLTTIRRTGAPPGRLRLELTESMLLHDINQTIAKMDALQRHGITFSLDDFGTGYSSLSYLSRLPVAELKIDQSFVRDALEDDDVAVITQTIIALGRTLQLQVMAEGVETEAQRDFLMRNDCHVWQGYLFGRPVPVAAFQRLVGH